jgi:mannitol operon transcriptional antiterminator
MDILNSRQLAILQYLLDASGPVSAEVIGNSIGVSARVIRQNIPAINSWLKSYQVEIDCKPKFGLLLVCPAGIKQQIMAAFQSFQKETLYTLKDRQRLILFDLLSQADQFSESQIRYRLQISKSTMTHDLNRVEEWLNQRDIFLSRRPRVGVVIQGRENDIRHALISLFYESDLEAELIKLALWEVKGDGEPRYDLPQASDYILSRMMEWGLNEGWNFISLIENELNAKFADGDHLTLTLYWVIANQRIKEKHFIQISDERIHYLSTRPEYKVVQDIIYRLLEKKSISFSEPELAQFTLEVMTARGTFTNLDETQSVINPQEKTRQLALELFRKIGDYLGSDLTNSMVVSQLADHLSRVVIRMKFDLPIQNNLTEETRKAYPLLWQATSKAIDEVWDEAGPPLPMDEIAYITMYVALALELNKNVKKKVSVPRVVVACPSGGVTVWMLVSRLRVELPEIEIKEVISLRDINNVDSNEVDAIISSAQVTARNIKSITVNPLLTEKDVKKIKQEFEFYSGRN